MTKYEFCWSLTPAGQCCGRRKTTIDGFATAIADDKIVVQADSTQGTEDKLRLTAEEIAINLARAMGLHKRQRLTLIFDHVKRTSTASRIGEIAQHLADQLPEMRDEVSWTKVSYVKLGAILVEDSREADIDQVIALADKARRDMTLGKMLDSIASFHQDPEKKLAPLYDILQVAETKLGGRKQAALALGIADAELIRLSKVTNDSAIATSRHPGKHLSPHRSITQEEFGHCTRLAEAIIREYAKKIPA